jgi:hypothetical protein
MGRFRKAACWLAVVVLLIASDNTNVLLSSTWMKALGLAAGMSYARNWVGKVDWYIDNTGVINNFRRMNR